MYSADMDDFLPWLKYPPLTEGRLSVLADALRDVHRETVALYEPLNGDDPWSHGCRVHVRSGFKIRELAKQLPWLTVVQESVRLRFTFAIDGIPFRFYKGPADDPPQNYLFTTFGELQQQQFVLDIDGLRPLDKILRIAVETDREGQVSAVKLVELDEAVNPTGIYLIPFDAAPSKVIPIETSPVDLPPVALEPIKDVEEEKKKKKKADDGTFGS